MALCSITGPSGRCAPPRQPSRNQVQVHEAPSRARSSATTQCLGAVWRGSYYPLRQSLCGGTDRAVQSCSRGRRRAWSQSFVLYHRCGQRRAASTPRFLPLQVPRVSTQRSRWQPWASTWTCTRAAAAPWRRTRRTSCRTPGTRWCDTGNCWHGPVRCHVAAGGSDSTPSLSCSLFPDRTR